MASIKLGSFEFEARLGNWSRTNWKHHSIRKCPFGIRKFFSHPQSQWNCYWVEVWGFGKTFLLSVEIESNG